ncbi:SurA N-terminal domain-containing protein [Fibrobacter sp. UWEL]|uniref:peptidylprolyl isomerase n=1 Tax=Fibrobacter sp. UWEL TaxID=1896209 RepID=UPI00092448F9|nr:SurA N-terminal domain-containing protein [Fibrobacter sp. UWEL]SHK37881.1 periplasmic chaperone for outer membrane proteins SurA [Fibrobacter sp. UWEL]
MSLKLISRGAAALLLTASIASAQLMNSKSLDVIRVDKVGISAGKIDSLAKMLGEQQLRGKKIDDQTMTQLRYAVIDNLVGQELIKLEAKKQGLKVPAAKVDSLATLFKKQFPSEDAFQKELKKSNTTMAQFKGKLEDQLKSEMLLEKKVPYPADPTEKQMQAYWELNKHKVSINDSISGIRLYVSTKGKSAQDIADTKDMLKGMAAQIRSSIRAKKMPFNYAVQAFAQQVVQSSDDPEAKKTGGMMITTTKAHGAAFEKAIAKMKVGDISDVYTEKDGVCIFMLTGRNDGKYESYKNQIENGLKMQHEQERQMQLKAYLDDLGKVYKVQYLDSKYTPPQAIGSAK